MYRSSVEKVLFLLGCWLLLQLVSIHIVFSRTLAHLRQMLCSNKKYGPWNEMAEAAEELGHPEIAEMCKELSRYTKEQGNTYLKTMIEHKIQDILEFYAIHDGISTPCPHCVVHKDDCDVCELNNDTNVCCEQWEVIHDHAHKLTRRWL